MPFWPTPTGAFLSTLFLFFDFFFGEAALFDFSVFWAIFPPALFLYIFNVFDTIPASVLLSPWYRFIEVGDLLSRPPSNLQFYPGQFVLLKISSMVRLPSPGLFLAPPFSLF